MRVCAEAMHMHMHEYTKFLLAQPQNHESRNLTPADPQSDGSDSRWGDPPDIIAMQMFVTPNA